MTGAFAARIDTSRTNGAAFTASKRYPAAGMRVASCPSGDPMNRTCAPCSRTKTSASDNAGKTCPPVPPAAITTFTPPPDAWVLRLVRWTPARRRRRA